MVARCDSSDSINVNESSALLKDDEKNKSQTSLCIYFDGAEVDENLQDEPKIYKYKKNKK